MTRQLGAAKARQKRIDAIGYEAYKKQQQEFGAKGGSVSSEKKKEAARLREQRKRENKLKEA